MRVLEAVEVEGSRYGVVREIVLTNRGCQLFGRLRPVPSWSPRLIPPCVSMAAFSRGLRGFSPRGDYICSRCLQFSTTYVVQSGHNRWSKIKHDKGAVDAKKNLQRSALSKEIVFASKCMSPQFFV